MIMDLKCLPILNGIMAYWTPVENAVRYIVTLYIDDQPISIKENERTELYCSFQGLANVSKGETIVSVISDKLDSVESSVIKGTRGNVVSNGGMCIASNQSVQRTVSTKGILDAAIKHRYYVKVEAESRTGEIIGRSQKKDCRVIELY